MKVWTTDANSIVLDDLDDLQDIVVFNDVIKEYLNVVGENDQKFFIVAPKGYGKTLLLKAKSKIYRENSGYTIIPEEGLCEKVFDTNIQFSWDEISKYKDKDTWTNIWFFSLSILIIQNLKKETVPSEIFKIVGSNTDLSPILKLVLGERKNLFNKLSEIVYKDVLPEIKSINQQIAIFIDNIDQAFDIHIGESFKNKDFKKSLSPRVWVNAQLGIMQAIKNIHDINKHIKIFVSLRSEAINLDNSPTANIQDKNYITSLQYNKEELREIFIKNIIKTPKQKLTNPNGENLFESFLGLNKIGHKFVKDRFEQPVKEDIFDFIWRHSFQRPRELVEIGKNLFNIDSNLRNEKSIRESVNKSSYLILSQYKNEMIPYFEDNVYNLFCKKVRKNVISKDEAKNINAEILHEKKFERVFTSLFRLGIIGWLERDINNKSKIIQKFLPAAQYNHFKNKEIPKYSDCYILHPSTNQDLHQKHGEEFHTKDNIIGYDYSFTEPIDTKQNHIHFNFGAVSLSFIVPLLSKCSNLAIIQKPNDSLKKLSSVTKLEVNINNIGHYSLNVYHDNLTKKEKKALVERWLKKESTVLFYTLDSEVVKLLVNSSNSISCYENRFDYAEFPNILALKNRDAKFNFYAINYTKEHYKKVKKILTERFSQALLIPVISDGYFYGDEKLKSGNLCQIDVECELQNDIYVYHKNFKSEVLFKSSKNTIVVGDKKEFLILLKKYKLFSEGVYRFYKLYFNLKKDIETDLGKLFEFYFKVQYENYINSINDENLLKQYFGSLTISNINEKLKKFAFDCLQRVEKLPTKYFKINSIREYQNKVKNLDFLPSFYLIQNQSSCNIEGIEAFCNVFGLLDYEKKLEIVNKVKSKIIFMSYSTKDSEIADKMENDLSTYYGLCLIRDEKHLLFKDKIEEYLKKIRDTDFALALISDGFLKSRYCMMEMIELFKENDFIEKILPIQIKGIDITKEKMEKQYYNYWKNLEDEAHFETKINDRIVIEKVKKYEDIGKIKNFLPGFFSRLNELKLISFADLEKENYLSLLRAMID